MNKVNHHLHSRRNFIGMFAAAVPLLSFGKIEPEIILYNGTIFTVNPKEPTAQALAIADGRLIAVGSNADILRMATAKTKKIDMGYKTILPGFIDAHSHPAYSGIKHLKMVDCDLRSIAAIKEAIRQRAAVTPKGKWVEGFKYDDTKTTEGRKINIADLDAAAPDHPVRITHRGGHTYYCNSLAFKIANVDEAIPNPQGGEFEKTSDGKLTGCVKETAADVFDKIIPDISNRSEKQEGVKLISKMMAKTGITSVTDAGGNPESLQAYEDAYEAGELDVRIYCMIRHNHIDKMIAAGVRTGMGNDWVKIGGMKMACDGSISERTARLSQPYAGRPDDYGIIMMDDEQMYPDAKKAYDAGWQIGIHANGDVGIATTLKLYERLHKENPKKDPRFRIEHCTMINENLVQRMKSLGVIPTPFSTYVYYHGEKMKAYGEERLKNMFALRSFLDAGLRPTQTSDYPPGPFEPMMALQSSVTRTDMKGTVWGANQKVTVEEAIKIGTINGAYASYEEKSKGSLEAGKLADLVVLGRNPFKEDPSTLITIPIERTMTGGKWVYES
ncbi:amidohydrolase [Lacibacter sediminis]|uniref:Amidohydrolase n=1 Tax=Lacibacter sediminis TaxID=2760713 RepID=A0A7G5XGD9_9BACT|nr:amidohydrolase [Lacibacter sediminis]QNA44542.1 amidohydrolase [Lacibacter sediminis]